MKKAFFIFAFFLCFTSFAITLDEVEEPMPVMGRFSNGDNIESTAVIKKTKTKDMKSAKKHTAASTENKDKKPETLQEAQDNILSTFADLSLKKLAKDTISEINLDESKINSDLSILWNAAAERSETMKYTIYKLSNPDEDKPDDSAVKKILRPIANISSLAGASIAGDPYMATGALIGGGLVNAFMKNDKEVNYKFSKVSDADMVLLVRKIDNLQKKLLELYIDYRTKEQTAKMAQENSAKREEIYRQSQNLTKEELTVADACYRNAKNSAQAANSEFMTSRAILENLVGKEALSKIEE